MNKIDFIVVLPYTETSRLFTASKTIKQEAFVGANGVVYYESQAHRIGKAEADLIVASNIMEGNKDAFVRAISK